MRLFSFIYLSLYCYQANAFLQRSSPSSGVSFRAHRIRLKTAVSSEQAEDKAAVANILKKKRIAILVCPAQFCVPFDYDVLFDNLADLKDELPVQIAESSRTVPLGRTDWIKVARQLPTQQFLQANLNVKQTLDWYFQAIEEGLSAIFAAEGEDVNICLVGHSIGGWVARAYLGGLSRSSSAVHRLAVKQCTSLVTLGTPHISPEEALVDQTRGLLRAIAESSTCSPKALKENHGISITCVCSDSIQGSFPTLDVEKLIAIGSYLPLTGSWKELAGDGIVPSSLAFLDEPAKRVTLGKCSQTQLEIRHCHVIPTPWNIWDPKAASILLPPGKYPSYVSKGVVEQWANYIQ